MGLAAKVIPGPAHDPEPPPPSHPPTGAGK